MASGTIKGNTWKKLGQPSINNGTITISEDYSEYLFMLSMSGGAANYTSFIVPKGETTLGYFSVYQDSSHHLAGSFSTTNNTLQFTQSSVTGWNNVVMKVYAR